MIGVHMEWTGIKEVDDVLKKMDDVLRVKYLQKACEAVVKHTVYPRVLARAPQGKTGNLRAGIKVVKIKKRKFSTSVGYKVDVGRPAYHASLIELGTRERFNKKGAYRGAIDKPSQFAFLRETLYDSEPIARAAFQKVMKAFIAAQNNKISTARNALK